MTAQTPLPSDANRDVPAEWLEERMPRTFIKWHRHRFEAEHATTEEVIAAAGIGPGSRVLDVGSGSGIPALGLAQVVGPGGHVTATDPSPLFVDAMKRSARAMGLTNLDVVQASAVNLPFEPQSFDAVTCNFGVMFFLNVQAGLRHIRELLKPGGKACFVAWGALDQNMLYSTGFDATASYRPKPSTPPPPVTSFPNPLRFSEPGLLAAELRAAGFNDVQEEVKRVVFSWNDSAESIADYWFDVRGLELVIPPEQWDDARAALRDAFQRFAAGDALLIPVSIIVASGTA